MEELKVFENAEFGSVRTTTVNGEIMFVGKDVAEILGYSNPRKAIIDHIDEEDKGVTTCDTLGGKQDLTMINESGLYSLILSSKMPNAKKFKHWVTADVLPAIRKTGMYATDEKGEMYSYNGVMYDRSKANYNFFFGSDHPIVEMTNEKNPDGKTLVVLKDSYTNVLAPWLIESYKNVILVDPRIFDGDFQMILDMYSPDEVLVVNYIFTTVFSDYCNLLENLYD